MSTWTAPGYTEVRELGQGGSGRVVLATHDATGTSVAIKYLSDNLTADETFMTGFRAEAHILSEIQSPYITRLYEYVETDGHAAIVMELVNGVSMRAVMREQGAIEPEAALVVLKGSLLGLAAAHSRGVVHRDYKPENVLVGTEGDSKLADFGIAARAGQHGALAGTPSYMAPEQWTGAPASPQTDIYAATATFFECLTGRPPYRAPGDLDLLRRQHTAEPIPVDDAPDTVRDLLLRGLAKEPKQRPKDATAFVRELEVVAGAAYGNGWEEDGRKKLARRILLLALLLPFPTAVADGEMAASAFAWTRLRKRAVVVTILVAVIAGALGALRAFGDIGAATATHLTAALPTTVVSAPPSVAPSPSLPAAAPVVAPPSSPPLTPAPTATPTVTPTHTATPSHTPTPTHTTKKPTPPKVPPSSPPKSSPPATTAPPPPADPAFDALDLAAFQNNQPCTVPCTTLVWQAGVEATTGGTATLHISVHPFNANGAPGGTTTGTWNITFTIASGAKMSFTESEALTKACGRAGGVQVQGFITAGGKTLITADEFPTVSCGPVTG